MYNGIINVYKERGYTSHDVVAKLRGILGQKKIGHTGTLDPDAEGVLPVCLGSGTKLCDMLTDRDKVYEAGLLLGVTTDTLDITGTVTGQIDWDAFLEEGCWKRKEEERPIEGRKTPEMEADNEFTAVSEKENVSESIAEPGKRVRDVSEKNQAKTEKLEERIYGILSSFVGKQMQVPPMYSALKVNGKKLVDLARNGVVMERKPREIEIYSIRVLSMDLPHIRLLVHCGKGTYIRSLCDDIGRKLGCGGCMESLIRRAVGSFRSEDAKTLDEITELRDQGRLESYIISPDAMFDFLSVRVDASYLVPAENGNPIPAGKLVREKQAEEPNSHHFSETIDQSLKKNPAENEHLRVYLPDGKFLGIYRWDGEKRSYVPEKIFLSHGEKS